MKIFNLFLALICVTFPTTVLLGVSGENENIVVKLATESQLIPLYLNQFKDANSGFTPSYLNQLEQVLSFDLNHNGMTQVVAHSTDKDKIAAKTDFNQIDDLNAWKAQNIFYVIKTQVSDKVLSVRMLAVNSLSAKKADVSLTGDFNKDRRQIHRMADMIHKALFNSDGIASTHIIYTVKKQMPNNKPATADIWEMDYDGGNARQITNENCLCVAPAYIPPKPGFMTQSFFYVSYRTGQPKIYIGNLKDGKAQRLTYLKGNQLMPTISKKRDKVAFISDVTTNPDLFIQQFSPDVGALGKPQQIFSTFKATQGTPTFSPDGTKVAFVSNKDGSPRIYVMDIPAPGTKLKDVKAKLITKHGKESTAPSWSPDGSKLAYASTTGGTRQIWIHDFESGQERQLTQGPGHKENPSWAPNSLHLVFNSSTHTSSELFMINLNQQETEKISSGTGEKRFPNWEPR